jgi:ParB/RepB/Spo0J family partition protein
MYDNANMPRRTVSRPRSAPAPAELRRVLLDRIDVPPRRMRRDLGDVASLAVSLGTYGQLAPVVCYEAPDGRLRLIAGERRLEATRRLHMARVEAGQAAPGSVAEIDVLVRTLADEQDPAELELIENEQRRELSDEEEADAFIQLARDGGRDLQQLAEMSGRSVAYVSKRIRVFEDPRLRLAVSRGELATSQAEELLALPEPVRAELVERSLAEGWSHDRMREVVRALSGRGEPRFGPNTGLADLEDDADFDELEEFGDADGFEGLADGGSLEGRVSLERPRDLTRLIRELDAILQELRPFQLTPRDDRALASLWSTLRMLAQASRERRAPSFPSLEVAQAVVAGRRRRG